MMDKIVGRIADGSWSEAGQDNTALSLDTATRLSQGLKQRLGQSHAALKQIIQSDYSTYSTAVAESTSAQAMIAQLLQGVDDLEVMLGDEEHGIHARLRGAMQNEAHIRERLKSNTAILQSLRQLSGINGELQAMDRMIQDGELDRAAERAESIAGMIGAVEEIEGTRVRDVLEERVDLARMNIQENALREFREIITVEVGGDLATLRVDMERSERVAVLFTALQTVAGGDSARHMVAMRIVNAFIRPVLAATAISRDPDSTSEFSVQLDADGERTGASATCDVVLAAVEYASRSLKDRVWTDAALTEVSGLVLQRCYLQRIPETRAELGEFHAVVDTLTEFETALLARCAEPPPEPPIHRAAKQLDELFVERQCARALAQARVAAGSTDFAVAELTAHQQWSLAFVRDTVEAGDAQLAPAWAQAAEGLEDAVFPRCVVSRSAVDTVAAAYRLANEAAGCSEPGLAQQLMQAAWCVLDVYGALFLSQHRQQLRRVPALGWQFHNDCLYAAHHAAILDRVAPGAESRWAQVAAGFLGLGARHMDEHVAAEARELQSLVNPDAFYDAASEAEQGQLAQMRRRVELALAQLGTAMRPPRVTPHVYFRALGAYLDAVFGATVDGIVGVRDIGVDDSQVLSEHCRSVHALTSLFRLDAEVLGAYSSLAPAPRARGADACPALLDSDSEAEEPAAGRGGGAGRLAKRHCRLGDKLLQLADILEISRADILARRRAGLLAQFTADELAALVRALFADTRERALDIDELRRI
ncbi:ribosome biogenesis protein ytm1 [Coemansia sp. RSA 2706]|nr:ribosome biogenesis protein ytm1 [Coemansia sp. RSA 2706]